MFDELRKILRIETTKVPMSDDLKWDDEELNKMKKDANKFKSELEKKASVMDKNSLLKKSIGKIISYLDKYWENLFISNFTIITENGKKTVIISRTNNIMESDFRKIRRILKMITGRNRLSKMIRCHGMGLSILFNLENEGYVNSIYGSLENIPLKFSEVDCDDFRKYQKKIQLIRKGNDTITFKDGDELKFIQNSLEKLEKLK